MQDDVPDEEITKDDKLPEDNDTPFSDPDDVGQSINPEDPATDAKIKESERYQDGLSAAAGQDDGTDRIIEKGNRVG